VAIILCGGLGTRLRDTVSDRPKVLVDIAGEPYLSRLIGKLKADGVRRIILSTGHMGEMVSTFVHSRHGDDPVECIREDRPLGTGGAAAFALDRARVREEFLLLNGDTIFTGSFAALRSCREGRPGARGAVAVVRVESAERYGRVIFDPGTGNVTAFLEKGERGPGWINAGAYVLEPVVLDHVPPGTRASLESEVLPAMSAGTLVACPYDSALFLDFGTPDEYARASTLIDAWRSDD
jgi:NDP-sugar pyrophosphorylase family protein